MKFPALLLLPFVLSACGGVPKCEDPETRTLVIDTFWDSVAGQLAEQRKALSGLAQLLPGSVDELKNHYDVELEQVIEEGHDSGTDAYTCKADFRLVPKDDTVREIALGAAQGEAAAMDTVTVAMLGIDLANDTIPAYPPEKAVPLTELFYNAALGLLRSDTLKDALAKERSTLGTAAATEFAAAMLDGVKFTSATAYAGLQMGAAAPAVLGGAADALVAQKFADGAYVTKVEFTSAAKTVDGQRRHYVEAELADDLSTTPVAMATLRDRYRHGKALLAKVAEAVATHEQSIGASVAPNAALDTTAGPDPEAAPAPAPAQAANGDAFAPSFDCTKATAAVERMICGSRELSEADVALAQAYATAKADAADPAKLRAEQIDWVRGTRNVCTTPDCVLAAIHSRTAQLSE